MEPPEPVIRPITPDEREAGRQLRTMAFSSRATEEPDPDDVYAPDERCIAAFLGDRMVVHSAAWPFKQWWIGQPVPTAAIGGVAAAPDVRGRGYTPRVLRALVDACLDDGDVISTLYPSLPGFYRRLGWEAAGHHLVRTVPTGALTALPRPSDDVTIRMMDPEADAAAAAQVIDRAHATGHGTLLRDETYHRRSGKPGSRRIQLVAERDGRVTGVLRASKARSTDVEWAAFRLDVEDLAADDHDSWLALWSSVASHAPVCRLTDFVSRPHEPLVDLLPTSSLHANFFTFTWMLRLIDAPGAIAARGWPVGVNAEVHLRITDTWLDRNDGPWVLTVEDGQGRLEPGGSGTVQLDIGTLSTLYSGHAQPVDLAWQRRLSGAGDGDVAALTEAFRSPAPWCDVFF